MKAAVTELDRRVKQKKLAAIGFCFGGGMVWRLLASGEKRLAAAAPFYAAGPDGLEIVAVGGPKPEGGDGESMPVTWPEAGT